MVGGNLSSPKPFLFLCYFFKDDYFHYFCATLLYEVGYSFPKVFTFLDKEIV